MEKVLEKLFGLYFLLEFSIVDIVFVFYVECMNVSLFYYKGYFLREDNFCLKDWFVVLEIWMIYRGI